MKHSSSRPLKLLAATLLLAASGAATWHMTAQAQTAAIRTPSSAVERPLYNLRAQIDWELLTFKAQGDSGVPVRAGDSLRDVVFFLFANAGGVGGSDGSKKNIAVDEVTLNGRKVPWKLDGSVLRVQLPQTQSSDFTLRLNWHGVVPRSPAGSGGIMEMLGGGGDLSSMFGGSGAADSQKPKNVDYGLYTYGNGILSLGSFWYPSLAVRQNGKWIDEAPEGLGDVAYAEMSDYRVAIAVSANNVMIAAPGSRSAGTQSQNGETFEANNVRDFAVLMSDQYVRQAKTIDLNGHKVLLEAFTTKPNAARAAQTLDVADGALKVFSRRFGRYPYNRFVVAEAPMRSGAGGMEYSGMTGIASMLYQDWGKQLNQLAQSLGGGMLGGQMGDLLGDLEKEAFGAEGGAPAQPPVAQQPINEEGADNPAADFLQSTLGTQKAMLDTLLETTIAHEVAHQWWAIGVGSDSLRAPWVDESLTNYSAMLYFEDRYGRDRAEQMMELHLKTPYSMGRMLGNADAPVNLKTSAYKSNVQYGAIVYGKGALFYDALRKLIGDEAFFAGLRDYYGQYNTRLASSHDLRSLFERRAPAKTAQIRALYKRWIEETHGDDDITGGKPMGLEDLLGGMLGGAMGTE